MSGWAFWHIWSYIFDRSHEYTRARACVRTYVRVWKRENVSVLGLDKTGISNNGGASF